MDYKSVLKRIVGVWKMENDPDNSIEECKFYDGENHVICRFEINDNKKNVKGTSILGYSKSKNIFTYYGFNSLGRNSYQTGEYIDGKLIYYGESIHDGKTVKTRTTMIFSDDDKTFQLSYEIESVDKWELIEKIKYVRSE